MRIIHSFWTKPMRSFLPLEANSRRHGGWQNERCYFMSWALSCLTFKQHYEVDLFTDAFGASLLIDQLELPYDNIKICLDNLDYHPDLWTAGKLYTYGLQKEPFLHVDSDIFLNKPFDQLIKDSSLVAQNLEIDYQYHSHVINSVNSTFKKLPSLVSNNSDFLYFSNAGVLGGTDIDFFNHYSHVALDILDNNKRELFKINSRGLVNNYVEQYIFYKLTTQMDKEVTYVFDDVSENYEELVNFHLPRKAITYRHVIARYKKSNQYSQYVENELRSQFPDYYLKILQILS